MKSISLKTLIFGSLLFLLSAAIVFLGLLSRSVAVLQGMGVSPEVIYLTEILPFIGLFLAFFRIILGVNVTNIFIPIVIILTSFVLGMGLTLEVLLISLVLAYLTRYLISEFHLHLAVKSSLIITLVSIGLILILPFLRNSKLFIDSNSHLVIIYGLLIIAILNEKLSTLKMTHNNLWGDLKNVIKTIIFAIICFLFLGGTIYWSPEYQWQWPWLKNFIMNFPESIFIALFLTFAIGRYTGLRVSEIFRFRKLIFKNN